jgi:hypothetical protein
MDAGRAGAVSEVGRMRARAFCVPYQPQALRPLAAGVPTSASGHPRNDVRVRDLLSFALFEYIEAFYNRQTRHSTPGMVSPAEYEQTQTRATYSKIKQPTT